MDESKATADRPEMNILNYLAFARTYEGLAVREDDLYLDLEAEHRGEWDRITAWIDSFLGMCPELQQEVTAMITDLHNHWTNIGVAEGLVEGATLMQNLFPAVSKLLKDDTFSEEADAMQAANAEQLRIATQRWERWIDKFFGGNPVLHEHVENVLCDLPALAKQKGYVEGLQRGAQHVKNQLGNEHAKGTAHPNDTMIQEDKLHMMDAKEHISEMQTQFGYTQGGAMDAFVQCMLEGQRLQDGDWHGEGVDREEAEAFKALLNQLVTEGKLSEADAARIDEAALFMEGEGSSNHYRFGMQDAFRLIFETMTFGRRTA